ncbi:uncharacterized protein [Lolium perenne]|uniref:uncharacterized protein n=1 Tax=Lolium perenne TaxID=4522 RepID=UPI0021F5E3C7|nr:uncharacterized protein LOC127295806 [Lolium perenne]
MAATSLSSPPSKVATAKRGGIPKPSSSYTQLAFCSRHAFQKIGTATALQRPQNEVKHARPCATTDNDRAAPAEAVQETTISAGQVTSGSSNGQQPQQIEPPKRVPLTARERLRAARVLGKYAAEPADKKKGSPEFKSGLLDALRETEGGGGKKGGRKRSGLPEAPSNLLDDKKRGMPKPGWTFDWMAALPVGTDVLIVAASFSIITTVMFGTTYLVWKLGAIHFNEY